ncbi:hypothetical protein J5226_12985 [Lysobacter sp. K5869]|uniref:hypothetical protein n=1 Tax=Lysobacter sp. K5869 TaxID=2820808 RepID=UPI001C060B10|nr:hypothetical protein [Lysobacter sp. K5869]QWP74613.1 hypothetical protein J5226_12985 [Lysobacter sp. K5869]
MDSSGIERAGMAWKRIAGYSLALLIGSSAVGFACGLFSSDDTADAARIEAIGMAATFAVYLAVFTRMAAGSAVRPIASAAWAAFVATALSLVLLWAVSAAWPRVFFAPFDALDIAVDVALLALAATFGVGLGSYLRDRRRASSTAASRSAR